jgi:hypothetical protein
MNYTELTAALQGYAENYGDEFVDMIPTFVRQAEQRIQHTVQLPTLRKTVLLTASVGSPYVDAPDDFLSAHSLALTGPGGFQFLVDKDANLIREAYPLPTSTGVPRYYALFGVRPGDDTELRLLLGPTPDVAYEMELTYSAYPQSIVDAGTTWLGDNFDSVLLYGSLLEANVYMKGEQDVQAMYQQRYEMAISQLKTLADGKMRRDSYRSGQVKVQVS